MPRKSKSLFRAPDAQHFQLVHRSQRDPLAHDADASQRVFKPVERINDQRKRPQHLGGDVVTLDDLEREVVGKGKGRARANEGEAAEHGIYYDDTAYDYMQHLRTVGDAAAGGGGGVEDSFLISVPKRGEANASAVYQGRSKDKGTRRTFDDERLFRKQPTLPADVLASADEITREQAYAQQAAVPSELQGLRPDMDPHLRQVLEALDDDAFVEDKEELDDDEDWLNELISGGERAAEEGDRLPFEFAEWGVDAQGRPLPPPSTQDDDDDNDGDDARTEQGDSWEDRFREFKASGEARAAREDAASIGSDELGGDDLDSEAADTLGSLPALSVVGGKRRRRKDGSDASGYSMSSSSMFRNKGLSTLDEMFDKVEADYENDEDEDDEDWDESASFAEGMSESGMSTMSSASNATFARALRSAVDAGPPEISREDFEGIMDDFLDNYEVVGNKMVGRLAGETGADKLHTIRRSLLEAEGDGEDTSTEQLDADWIRKRFLKEDDEDAPPQEDLLEHEWIKSASERPKDRWDVDTILTTRTNVENHPRLIGGNTTKSNKPKTKAPAPIVESDSESSATETEETARRTTVARPKGETASDKRARKAAVKAERQARRVEKRERQEIFAGERRKQVGQHARRVGAGGAADVSLAAVDRKMNVVSLN